MTFLGRIGSDALGNRLKKTLKQHGIASHVAQDKKEPSGTSIALTFENGHRHFVSCLPSCRALAFKDLNLNAMAACNHLLRADIWFSEAMLNGGNKRLFQAARRAKLDVSLDLNWDPHWGSARQSEIKQRKLTVRESLPWVNLVHGNVSELTKFADTKDLEQALKRLLDWEQKLSLCIWVRKVPVIITVNHLSSNRL